MANAVQFIFQFSQVTFQPVILEDISLRASTFDSYNLERRVLRSGDFFQLQIEVSGGRVEWFKDGLLVPKVQQDGDSWISQGETDPTVFVDQPGRTQLLSPDAYPGGPVGPLGLKAGKEVVRAEQYPPNLNKSFLGGRCKVNNMIILSLVLINEFDTGGGRRSIPC